MNNSNLITLLRTFSPPEIVKFRKFVHSPYFNSNQKVVKFFEILRKYHPAYNSAELEKKFIYKKLFPEKEYNDKEMRYLIHDLFELGKEFAGDLNYRKDKFFNYYNILSGLSARNLRKHFESQVIKSADALKYEKYANSQYFYYKYILSQKSRYFKMSQPTKADINDFIDEGESIIFLLVSVLSYILNTIRVYASAYNLVPKNNIIIDFVRNSNLEELLNKIKNFKTPEYKLFEMNTNLILMQVGSNGDKFFFNIIRELKKYVKLVHSSDLEDLFIDLNSYCVDKELEGKNQFLRERFKLNELALRENVYSSGYFNKEIFKDMYLTAVKLKEFDWIKNFINNYSNKLDPDNRENIINHAYAVLNFALKNYDITLDYLSRLKTTDIYYKFWIKDITLKVFYEKKMYESALQIIDTYNHFLSKIKVSPTRKRNVRNFIKFTHLLIKMKLSSQIAGNDLINLEKRISETKELVQRNWLMEKISELKQIHKIN